MGPIALFDKSFLEALNVDEAVLFDYFFYPNLCPVFFVETLGDLEKPQNRGRQPEEVVGSLAYKTPQIHGGPNTFHQTLVLANLLGQEIPLAGQIAVSGGIPVRADGGRHVVFKPSPESEALARWQRGQFEEVERLHASQWRESLRTLDLSLVAAQASNYGLDLKACKSLENAKVMAEQVIDDLPAAAQIHLALDKFRVKGEHGQRAVAAWADRGRLPLEAHAPYAHFVLRIQVFFEIALATGKISVDRPSNINDMAYLFYLPFCMVFVSSDRLHRSCAPMFLRADQEFVWGPDLKRDLRMTHDSLMQLPEESRNLGLIRLNPAPVPGSRICTLHQRMLRPRQQTQLPNATQATASPLAAKIWQVAREAEFVQGALPDFRPDEADSITIERMLLKKRGSWYQVPHDMEPTDQ